MTKDRRNTILPLFMGMGFCFLFLTHSDCLYNAATASIKLLITAVLPFLIPYAVLSSVIVSSLSLTNGKFAIIVALIIGNICGAPIGAMQISHLYKCGSISKKEAGILLPAVSASSPAFCINAVGGIMLHNRRFGLLIWIIQVILNITLVSAVLFKKGQINSFPSQRIAQALNASQIIGRTTSAVASVILSVIFFSSISAVLAEELKMSAVGKAIINAILEMSGGCDLASQLDSPISFVITAFSLGFCGISVATQIFSCADDIPKRNYVITKLLCGGICAIAALLT